MSRICSPNGNVIDILVQPHRKQRAAERFFRRLLRGQGKEPFRIITDQPRSYSAGMRTILCDVTHNTQRHANNRAEASSADPPKGNCTCAESNLLAKPNGFSPSTVWSRIFSE